MNICHILYHYILSWLAQPWKNSKGYFVKLSTIIIQMETCNYHFQKSAIRDGGTTVPQLAFTQSHVCFIYCYMIKNIANDVLWELFGVSVLRWDRCVGHTPKTVTGTIWASCIWWKLSSIFGGKTVEQLVIWWVAAQSTMEPPSAIWSRTTLTARTKQSLISTFHKKSF